MNARDVRTITVLSLATLLLFSCAKETPTEALPPPDTPIPATQAPSAVAPTEEMMDESGGAAYGVDLIGAWVDVGVPETEPFEYEGVDGNTYSATFEVDVLPLFTTAGAWFENSAPCSSCHFGLNENSAHEMDLTSYAGILAGADTLEEPPGEPLLGESQPGATDYNWSESGLRARLRNNRMPPGFPFDATEANRNGPTLTINGVEVSAVDLIGAWVDAGVPETEAFGEYKATFAGNVLPLFTENNAWFEGSQACSGCHFGLNENSAHEMDLTSYAGILAGADTLEEPPGEALLGESAPGAADYDWSESGLRARLRNNRMPPGFPFDATEANRNGPTLTINGVEVSAVDLIGAWVDAGVPETE